VFSIVLHSYTQPFDNQEIHMPYAL
jgi:hypothetical protein